MYKDSQVGIDFNITTNSDTAVLTSTVSYLDYIDAPGTEITTIYQVG